MLSISKYLELKTACANAAQTPAEKKWRKEFKEASMSEYNPLSPHHMTGLSHMSSDLAKELGGVPSDHFGTARSMFGDKFKAQQMMDRAKQEAADAVPDSFAEALSQSMAGSARGMMVSPMEGIAKGIGQLAASPFMGVSKAISDTLGAPGSTYGYRLDKYLNSGLEGLLNRVKAPDIAAEKFITTLAGNMADKATDLLGDITSKAVSTATEVFSDGPARKAILETLRKEDPIIGQLDDTTLMEAYHSISKFAPTLAKDKNAVRSALRVAAQSEGGLDYHTIAGLAKAEADVRRAKSI